MPLTPEQFNLLATRDDFNQLEQRLDNIDLKLDKLINSVDSIAKKIDLMGQEATSNIGAHDRMNESINW